MYYKLIELRKSRITGKLHLDITDVEGDRHENEECFNPAGFYYYQTTKSDEEALAEFQQKMQSYWKSQIANLENLVGQLDNLVIQHNEKNVV